MSALSQGVVTLVQHNASYCWLSLAAENRQGSRRLRLWRYGLCRSRAHQTGSRSECAHCWLRPRSWAHNLRERCIRPKGQTATLCAEWRFLVCLAPVSRCEVVCGGGEVEQNEEESGTSIKGRWNMTRQNDFWRMCRCSHNTSSASLEPRAHVCRWKMSCTVRDTTRTD